MKVLHVIARMNVGGTARYLSMLSNGLEADGIKSSVATGFVQGAEVEDPSINSVKLHRINHFGRAINPINDYLAAREFKKLVAAERPDVIHSHTFKAGLIARIQKRALIKAAGKEIKFIHTFHGHLLYDPEFSGLKRNIIVAIEKSLAKKSDRLVTVGQRVAAELLADEVGNPAQYINIPPGVLSLPIQDTSSARNDFQIDQHKIVVGWLARVTGVKNPLLAVEVAKKFPDLQFIFGGSGDLFDELISKASANCHVLGWVDAASFISACDVILSTSENEGMPVALIEAQMAGRPVVATNVGSVAEVVIDGQTGFITSKDLAEIVQRLGALVADPRLITQMGQAAKIHANKAFSPSAMIEKHIDLYRNL